MHEVNNEWMRQFLLGAIMYANNHKGVAGPDIEAVMKDQHMSRSILRDPLHPDQEVGYVYVPGDFMSKDAAKIPVLYQKWQGGRLVGFADGHVETMESRAAVEKLMQQRK